MKSGEDLATRQRLGNEEGGGQDDEEVEKNFTVPADERRSKDDPLISLNSLGLPRRKQEDGVTSEDEEIHREEKILRGKDETFSTPRRETAGRTRERADGKGARAIVVRGC